MEIVQRLLTDVSHADLPAAAEYVVVEGDLLHECLRGVFGIGVADVNGLAIDFSDQRMHDCLNPADLRARRKEAWRRIRFVGLQRKLITVVDWALIEVLILDVVLRWVKGKMKEGGAWVG